MSIQQKYGAFRRYSRMDLLSLQYVGGLICTLTPLSSQSDIVFC